MNYKKLITIIDDKTVAQWNALETEEALSAVFDKNYNDTTAEKEAFESEYNADAALADFYADDGFATVAASLDEAAAPVLTILADVLDHLPEPPGVDEEIAAIINRLDPDTPEGAYLYAALLYAMMDGDFADRLEDGFGVPEARAARRAYGRYLNFKTGNTGNTGVVIPDPDDNNADPETPSDPETPADPETPGPDAGNDGE